MSCMIKIITLIFFIKKHMGMIKGYMKMFPVDTGKEYSYEKPNAHH